MDIAWIESRLDALLAGIGASLNSPPFYTQVAVAGVALVVAYAAAGALRGRLAAMAPNQSGAWLPLQRAIHTTRDLLFPILTIVAFGVAVSASEALVGQSWLIRTCQSLAVIFFLYAVITRFVHNRVAHVFLTWVVIPVAILYIFDWLDPIIAQLEAIDVEIGNIRISAYGVVRVIIFGSILFWLGRLSNSTGQRVIREQEALELPTREVLAKLFQGLLFLVIFLLLLQVMGISLTALTVFGGAVGVGLGFGLQSIASNFVSGVIILLDRSLTVGDYVELDDGRAGTIRDMNMRSTVLETFDGKDVVVPNEKFITSTFVNWTHKNTKQRYQIEFQVSYDTDMPLLLDLVRRVVSSHPQVLSGPDIAEEEHADAEIKSFGESGIDILVEFWMAGIDDGPNHVGADLMLMIWQALKDAHIEIPFPQREIRMRSS